MSFSFLKKVFVLAVLCVGIASYYAYRQVPKHTAPFRKAVDAAAALRIEQGGRVVQFSKPDKQWKVHLSSGALVDVDEAPWGGFLASLKDVTLEDEISNRADRHADYDVTDASGTRVVLEDAQKKVLAGGIFGKQAANYVHIYFRPLDKPEVFMARGLYKLELERLDPETWRNRQLVDVPEPSITAIRIERGSAKSEFIRVSTEAWSHNGVSVDANRANELVGKLAHLRVDGYVNSAESPGLTFQSLTLGRFIIFAGNAQTEILVGPLDKKNARYPLASKPENGIAWLSQATVDSLLNFK